MYKDPGQKKWHKPVIAYSATLVLCVLILIWAMELWQADLKIPFRYKGDALYNGMLIKGIIDNGWYLHNDFIGTPGGLDMHDFNNTYLLHYSTIKLISALFPDFAVTMNLFFLLSFPLTTLTSLVVFRSFRVSYLFSALGSLLYTFLPYHFFRGQGHLYLAVYYTVPLIIMVILWLCSQEPLFFDKNNKDKKRGFVPFNAKSIAGIFICLMIASSGVYYAFFASFLLLIAGANASFRQGRIHHVLSSVVLIGVISIGLIINLYPTLAYKYKLGDNPEVAKRSPIASEIYGMKIIQLLSPVNGHIIPGVAKWKSVYNEQAPLVNENKVSSLGAVGSLGFLVLIGSLIFKGQKNKLELINHLSVLNIAAVLIGTIGGFGSVFAHVVSPQIRSYNRISIYIAFFSLFAVILVLQHFYQKYAKTNLMKLVLNVLVLSILAIGILDQRPLQTVIPEYKYIKAAYKKDSDFIKNIEASLPRSAMIFQLPYVPFPEHPCVYQLCGYEHFKGYLHSKMLHWSYGAMKGRESDAWQRNAVRKPLEEFLELISATGFSGIYIDRTGYEDGAAELEARLAGLLKSQPIASADKRLAFYDIRPYARSTD